MRLEDRLKVKGFRDEQQRTLINLFYTYSIVNADFKDMLKKVELTPQQFNILRILRGQYPAKVKVKDVKGRMIDRSSDLTRIVDRMQKKGLVLRSTSTDDRRQMNLTITDRGLRILEVASDMVLQFEENFTELPEQELKKLNELLAKLRD